MTAPPCPRCQSPLLPAARPAGGIAPRPTPKAVPPFPGDAPPHRLAAADPPRSGGKGWGLVRAGVDLMACGTALAIVFGLLGLIVSVAPAGPFIGFVLGVGFFAGCALMLVGLCLCCTAPRGSGAEGWAWGLIGCLVATAALAVAAAAPAGGALSAAWPLAVAAVVLGVPLCLCILFMLLRATARFFGDADLGGGFLAFFFVAWGVPAVVAVGVPAAATAGFAGPAALGALLTGLPWAAAVFGLVLLAWLDGLLRRLHEIIPPSAGGRA
jgi:hypothetical protein